MCSTLYSLLAWAAIIYVSAGARSTGFKLAESYGDHMVLQSSPQSAEVWGYGQLGATVNLTFDGKSQLTKVRDGGDGRGAVWGVKLPPTPPGGPFVITVIQTHGANVDTVVLKDVLFGDVWLCGGQSNMEFVLTGMFDADEYLNNSVKFPEIRIFGVNRTLSATPMYDVIRRFDWAVPSREILSGTGYIFSYFSAICWVFGVEMYTYRGYPIGLIEVPYGGTPVEAWMSPPALAACGIVPKPPYAEEKSIPTRCWNGMISPMLNMTIYGVIFYQGEGNANDSTHYDCAFAEMISDWRFRFTNSPAQFPFGFVQLSSRMLPEYVVTEFPVVRWKQTGNYGYAPNPTLPNTFMAVAMDLGDPESPYYTIHPRYKVDVGKRLALGAKAVAYGDVSVRHQGPYPTRLLVNNTKHSIDIEFSNGTELLHLNGYHGFEIQCNLYPMEQIWLQAPTSPDQPDPSSVQIQMSGPCGGDSTIYHTRGVRYGWRDTPCSYKNCAAYSIVTKLPAPSFYIPIPDSDSAVYTVWVDDVLPAPLN